MAQQQHLYKCPNHIANLNRIRLNNKWCDVIIRADGREFHAHKVVIAANIKHFDTMFSSDSFRESKEGVINMQDFIKGEDLEALLSYAYTGEILLTDSNALDLLVVANYLGEDVMKDACVEFLKKYLKKELACVAYKLASTIDCLALKRAAKTAVLANFAYCSQTADYLDFDYEQLADILFDGKKESDESQRNFFEGIARWIMHDFEKRRIRMKNLLSCIDVGKLTDDYLINYLGAIVSECNDKSDIIKDVMLYYHNNKSRWIRQETNAGQTLLAIGRMGNQLNFQTYNLTEKKWSPLLLKDNFSLNKYHPKAAVLNNKLYYTNDDSQKNNYLNVFDPTTKQSTRLHVSASILGDSAICTHGKYLYLCGGTYTTNGLRSNQVLRYDPLTNSTVTLAPLTDAKLSAAAIFYQGCLHVLGGIDGSGFITVEKYNFDTNTWTALPSMCEARYGHSLAILDGKLYACGGAGKSSVEVYDPVKNSWQLVASMNKQRYDFILVPQDGKLLAIGGMGESTTEVYDPRENEWQLDQQLTAAGHIRRPQGGLMSSSCIANDLRST